MLISAITTNQRNPGNQPNDQQRLFQILTHSKPFFARPTDFAGLREGPTKKSYKKCTKTIFSKGQGVTGNDSAFGFGLVCNLWSIDCGDLTLRASSKRCIFSLSLFISSFWVFDGVRYLKI